MNDKNLWYVFVVHPHADGLHRRLLLKVLLHPEGLHVLEDHGSGVDWEKLSPRDATRRLWRYANSQRFEVVSRHDLLQGHHVDLVPSPDQPERLPEDLRNLIAPPEDEPRTSTFDYHREGQPAPQRLEIHGDAVYLDGHRLSSEEVDRIMETVRQQQAVLRHPLQKAESFAGLAKVEPELAAALGHVRSAVKQGRVPPEALKTLTRQIFTDSMVPAMGNRKAYYDFLSRPRPGVHVHIDANDFGDINKKHGFEVGNQAIVALGRAIRAAVDESVGRKQAKSWRIGGDEFRVHVPTPDHAAAFARNLRQKLEAIPPIGGTHGFSVSMGFGQGPDHAEFALIDAKTAKAQAGYPTGRAKTHVASRLPGHDGPLPL